MLAGSPFDLSGDIAYKRWRDVKMSNPAPALDDLLVVIKDPYFLSKDEKSSIVERREKFNMAIYQLSDTEVKDKSLVHALGKQLAMECLDTNIRSDEDSVSSLEVREQSGNKYIPYTNRALSWHTDGYYNLLEKQIYGIIMHCVMPAEQGGVNALLNPEAIYIALRDENPAYIEALMHPEAMTIPDNIESGKVIRAEQTGPVFMVKESVGSKPGRLHMRFSARKRNIVWRDTEDTRLAVTRMNELMADEKLVTMVALTAGQGIVCNNVLHNRSSFIDCVITFCIIVAALLILMSGSV